MSITTYHSMVGIKFYVNENFFNTWTPQMGYVLGYLYADGSLEDASYLRGKYIRVSSTDRQTIVKIKRWLKSKHTIVKQTPWHAKGKERFLLRIGNQKLYESLLEKGLYPNKSLTIRLPKVPQHCLAHFVRGYFDGDGCVNLYTTRGKRGQRVIRKLTIIFTSGSFDFLLGLCDTLQRKLKLRQLKIYKGTRAYQLRYYTSDSVKLFQFMYETYPTHTYLPRKLVTFKKFFKLRQRI